MPPQAGPSARWQVLRMAGAEALMVVLVGGLLGALVAGINLVGMWSALGLVSVWTSVEILVEQQGERCGRRVGCLGLRTLETLPLGASCDRFSQLSGRATRLVPSGTACAGAGPGSLRHAAPADGRKQPTCCDRPRSRLANC